MSRGRLRLPFESNWANDIKKLRVEYEIAETDAEIEVLSYEKWKEIVSDKIESKIFKELCEEALTGSKTKDLCYKSFCQRRYLTELDSISARKVARVRSRMVRCKANQKSSHRDLLCRAGCEEVESQEHVVNFLSDPRR